MNESFHYPPELFSLLADTIPILCRSKKDVVLFFRGAGVPQADLLPIEQQLIIDASLINKYQISRTVLEAVNARGDSGLTVRREIIKRVVEFEDFSTCWPNDQFKAKGMVGEIRKVVNVKDSFTRMKQEREAERSEAAAKSLRERTTQVERKEKIKSVDARLTSLFGMDDRPQVRGKLLEQILNDLFKAYGILIREDFRRKEIDGPTVLEQIDGVIDLDGTLHLVEMKWLKDPVGMADFSPHLVRLFGRANVHGIFISSSEYTEPVLKECSAALNQRTMFLCSLREIVMLLQREGDLLEFLRKKSRAAIVDKRPYMQILS